MSKFIAFSEDALRICANLAQRHDAFVSAIRREEALPRSMFFTKQPGREYLMVKRGPRDNGTSLGARSVSTERQLALYQAERTSANQACEATVAALGEIIAQYRALKLPLADSRSAAILRELDYEGALGVDFMLVGTNAFAAYQIEAGCRFPALQDATDDFDLAWCRGSGLSILASDRETPAPSLLEILKRRVDAQFRLNPAAPYQLLDQHGFQVELLVAPSMFRTLPRTEVLSPLAVFQDQEWLLKGRAVRHVVVARDGRSCPIFAPDPRWMALHKLWLSTKPERLATKRPKDRAQGDLLLDAVRETMQNAYPLNIEFVLDLPLELRPLFDDWAASRKFTPGAGRARSHR